MFMKYRINFKHLNRKSSKKSINLIFRIIINKLLRKKGWKIVIWNWSKLSSNLTSKRSKNGNSNLLEDYGAQHRTVVHVGKTKRRAAGRRFQSMPGKMQIMLQDFRDFRGADNHEEDKTAKKKERERIVVGAGRWCLPGRRDITEQRCTHIVAKLARYCFMLQNIAFYLRAAASHVENSLVRGITCLSCHPSYIEQG